MPTTKPATGRVRLARLRNLLRVMRKVAEKPQAAYDISFWGRKYKSVEAFAEDQEIDIKRVPRCKTVACTAGWAGLDPWFRNCGLRFVQPRDRDARIEIRGEVRDDSEWFDHETGLRDFFGLEDDEPRRLFSDGPVEDPTAADVAKYIEKLIAKYEKAPK